LNGDISGIAYIGGDPNLKINYDRLQGYQAGLKSAGIESDPAMIIQKQHDFRRQLPHGRTSFRPFHAAEGNRMYQRHYRIRRHARGPTIMEWSSDET